MDFFIPLLLLSLGCVSCDNCSDALHEALRKNFSLADGCGDCLTLSPGISSEENTWAGFCSGDKFFLFQDWKCREDNDLLNKTDYVVLGGNELCELVDENHALNQECLKKFNSEICSELSGSEDLECRDRGRVKDRVEFSFHNLTQADPAESFLRSITGTTKSHNVIGMHSVHGTEETSTEGTITTSTSTTGKTSAATLTSMQTFPPTYPWVGDCEPKEFFFNGHCYFITHYSDYYTEPTRISGIEKEFQSYDIPLFDVTKCCRNQHPWALGLAVETKEENDFILRTLQTLLNEASLLSLRVAEEDHLKALFLTSGIRWNHDSFKADEWQGWNLKVNRSILNPNEADIKDLYNHYAIDAGRGSWVLVSYLKKVDMNVRTICERPYNPKNTLLELHKTCLQEYRKSPCYNTKEHVNFCCAKDDKGEIWFACPNVTQSKSLDDFRCAWTCKNDGFFENDRPFCKGRILCHQFYLGNKYLTAATRYAISGCPKNLRGFSTWYCSSNGSYIGTPDYSLCCRGAPQCKNTDALLNVWVGCPSKKTSKQIACPPNSLMQEALVEWYCHENGSFSGNSPDFSNCHLNVSCVQMDRFNREWRAPVNTVQEKICPPTFVGSCFWKCEKNGKFDGPEPDCSLCKADWMEKIEEKIKNNSNHEEIMEIMVNYTKTEDLRVGYGYVLNLTSDCVALFKRQVPEHGIKAFDKFLKSYSKILKNIATNATFWSSFSVTNRGEYSKQILSATQNAAFAVLDLKTSPQDKYNATLAKSEVDGFDFFVAYNPSVGSRFPLENFPESDWYLDIKKINENNPTLAAMGLVMSYTLSSLMFPSSTETEDLAINAPAITFTVAEVVNGDVVFVPDVVVSISFKHQNRTKFPATQVIKRRLHNGEQRSGVFNSTVCCYYRNSKYWSIEGCSVTYSSKDRTNCTCNHLSTIGLLMSIHKYVPDATLELLSTLSSSVTIISLILSLLVFYFLDNAKSERVFIGKNLCFCLLVGHFMLLTVLDKKFFNIPENMCRVYAILLHYVFMAAFAWMFVEGCHLYRMLVLVFDSGIDYRRMYVMIGYGAPFVVVGMTALVGFLSKEEPYGQDEFCWLKAPNYVWAFIGPVLVTTSINLCILATATKLTISSRRRIQKSNAHAPKSVFGGEKGLWLKGWFSLSTLLGITWFLGLAYIHYNEGLVYIFVFFNGLQGFFIFLFRCALCEQYKNMFLKKMKSWFFKSKSADHKKNETVRSETKVCAISAMKSSSAKMKTKDSGCDVGSDRVEDCKVSNKLDKAEVSSTENSEVNINSNIILTPAMSEEFLRNRVILKNFFARKSNSSSESDNFPELSYHNIYHPN